MTALQIYTFYKAKSDRHNWDNDCTYIRIWLQIEVMFFIFWILSGICFLAYAFLSKFKSISKNEKLLLLDDNIWNDKSSDDFLRYLKLEYFLFSYITTFLFMEITIGFTDLW